jgi:Firmicute plasmid replication protein (RepL)
MTTHKSVIASKKVKLLGTQQFIHKETGEIVECQVMELEERDANFQKFWLGHVISAVDELSNAKMKIVFYILGNADSNNVLLKTIDEIVKETGISNKTVVETLKVLQKHDIITRRTGAILLNPNVIFRGGTSKRRAVLTFYEEMKSKSFPPAKQSND